MADAALAGDVLKAPGFLARAPAVLRDPRPTSRRTDFHSVVQALSPGCRARAEELSGWDLVVGEWPEHGVSMLRHSVMEPAILEALPDDVRSRVQRLVRVRDLVGRLPGGAELLDGLGARIPRIRSEMEFARAVIGTGRPLGYALSSALYFMLENRAAAAGAPVAQMVRESLRLAPPAWLIVRAVADAGAAPPELLLHHDLRRVRSVAVCTYLTHRDPAVWSDGERWDPQRWDGRKPNETGFVPFGAGEERCFGRKLSYDLLGVLVSVLRDRLDDVDLVRARSWRPGPLYGAARFTTERRV